jgi:hypothetical protein
MITYVESIDKYVLKMDGYDDLWSTERWVLEDEMGKRCKTMNDIKFQEMGWVKYNDLNCRVRTAFRNKDGEEMFLEVSSGVFFDKKNENRWMVITSLFYLKDERDSYSKEFKDIISEYYKEKYNYDKANLIKLLERLGLPQPNLIFCEHEQYRVYNGNDIRFGNDLQPQPKHYTQLNLFEEDNQ